MKSFRNPKYLERNEDVVFDLEQAIKLMWLQQTTETKSEIILNSSLITGVKSLHLIGIMPE